MDKKYNKVSESEMEVVTPPVVMESTKQNYSIDNLKNQELFILKSMNDFRDQKQKDAPAEIISKAGLVVELAALLHRQTT